MAPYEGHGGGSVLAWVGAVRKVSAWRAEGVAPYEGHGQGRKGGSVLAWVSADRKVGARADEDNPAPTGVGAFCRGGWSHLRFGRRWTLATGKHRPHPPVGPPEVLPPTEAA